MVPGGGQNDLWHHLTCKGRFAGEIRIELTYYDTRPKDEKVEEKRQEAPIQNAQEQAKEGIGGPRQPKSVKRRPLPADPTQPMTPHSAVLEHSQPSPAAYVPPSSNHHTPNSYPQHASQSSERRTDTSPLPKPVYQHANGVDPISPIVYNRHGQDLYLESLGRSSLGEAESAYPYTETNPIGDMTAPRMDDAPNSGVSWHQGLLQERALDQTPPVVEESYLVEDGPALASHLQPRRRSDLQSYNVHDVQPNGYPQHQDAYSMELTRTPPTIPQQHSMPEVYPNLSIHPISQQSHRHSLPHSKLYKTPTRHHSVSASGEAWPSPAIDEDGPPPPPPIHRTSGLRSSQQRSERDHVESYAPIIAPAPLNVRNHRGTTTGSPLAHFQSATLYNSNLPPSSPSNSQPFSHSGVSVSSYTTPSQPSRKQSQLSLSQSPAPDFVHAIPPSLVPGYEASVADQEPQRLLDEKRISIRRSFTNEPNVSYQAFPGRQGNPEPVSPYQPLPSRPSQLESHTKYHSLPVRVAHSEYSPQYQPHPSRSSQSQTYPSPRGDHHAPVRQQDQARERISHSPAPINESGPVKPDPRTPMRKSVSPAPERPPGEGRTSAVPFSPDSYETFNPSLSTASSINVPGPQYNTPEQARDAFHEREKEARLSEGPIIDSDGQVIDPSDHLPTDTWAPEPETKPPRKGPEITLRFRHTPQGAQPMPLSARRSPNDRSGRPHSNSTPVYAHNPDSTSPASFASRTRLQKRVPGSPSQPNSSPIVPTVHTYVARSSMPRASVSDYPLPSIENHGYGHADSIYSNGSPSHRLPPPVPGKIPIAPAEDIGMSALSEEMRRIDIGVGGGQARSRRSRFGA